MSCNAHLRIGLGCFNSSIVELKKNVENYIWIFFLFSLIFAVKMLSFLFLFIYFYTYVDLCPGTSLSTFTKNTN